jgi:hypothetical protein
MQITALKPVPWTWGAMQLPKGAAVELDMVATAKEGYA